MKNIFIKNLLFSFLFLTVILLPHTSFADKLTHTIGTTGYMIQEAMWAKASFYDPDNYNQAVKLQYQAKAYMRGTHKNGRNTSKAIDLTQQAYVLAKKSRDRALKYTGKPVSY